MTNNLPTSDLDSDFKLRDIKNLKICVIIAKRGLEEGIKKDVKTLGGRILSVIPARGVSHSGVFDVISANTTPCNVIFACVRSEDISDVISYVSVKYELYLPGAGRAFSIDCDGYLGAKAIFL